MSKKVISVVNKPYSEQPTLTVSSRYVAIHFIVQVVLTAIGDVLFEFSSIAEDVLAL
jgi:hypothetical protein